MSLHHLELPSVPRTAPRQARAALPVLLSFAAVLGAAGCLAGGLDGDASDAGPTTSASSSEGSGSTGAATKGTTGTLSLPSGAAPGGSGASSGGSGATASSGSAVPTTGDAGSAPHAGSGYQINLGETSVSGFSSGAFFAVQFHVAFSSTLKGAAIFAGGPYDCAQGSANAAETTCLMGSPDVSALVSATKKAFSAGAIDDPTNLANERVFIFGGADDSVVHPSVVDSLNAYYGAFIGASSIQYESKHPGTSHTMPTLSYGGNCDSVASPYVGDCHYDGAGTALQQIYGTLSAPATTLSGKILSFSQASFVPDPGPKGLAETGYYYVPASCAAGEPCRIHVSFHGCEQNAALVNDAYYGHAGYNEWADTNHMIVLYPQATSSNGNDYECWDFWGYDGSNYADKSGTQLSAVYAMIEWLAAGGASDGGTTSVAAADAGASTGPGLPDAGGLGLGDAGACITASNTAQVAAGRAVAIAGFAYAKGSDEPLGKNDSSTNSSLRESASGYYTICL